jgi:glycosyltransferase involved in cell wall biosynthesis
MVWAVSDIAVLPSHREGLPVSLQEACAAGLPIVTTNAPGCREIVKEHETGYLVDVGDTKALASSIAKFLADERLRKEFGERGRKRAEELFDAGKLADQVIKLYCNMPD